MRKSIRARIALTFIVLMALVLVAIGVFQYAFLDRFYASDKQKDLIKSWEMVSADATEAFVPDGFDQFCSVHSLTYCVTDATLTQWITNSADGNQMATALLGIILGKEDEHAEIVEKTEDYTLLRLEDRFSGLTSLELWGTMSNGRHYLATCPVASLAEAASTSFRFYLYIGLAAIALGAIIMWLISDKLEKDVSVLQHEKEQLQRDIAEKTRVDAMRREFLANVSHELKTPIALIQGYAEGLRDNVNQDEASRAFYSDVIVDEAGKMNQLVRQITTLNQLEFGEDELEMDVFDLPTLIRGVLEKMRVWIAKNEVQIYFSENREIKVVGDAFRIEEVVTNYLTNALHHAEGEKRIEISCEETEDTVCTTVFNTGKPIPEEDLPQVWTKFYKVDKARTRAYGGSGIGLSIVKAIMDAHKQTCSVENRPDGVAFSFTLHKEKPKKNL